ncbi:hypothetical protein FHS56_000868 [Thermonema lapsum]|jgi:DNA-directed RNA polymerase subunit RPC12/RpoP|uniref:HNH nuclease domain-containing protein n=1 Tax=Thermonema lapsum TaxID=28195 RepID=A0A846MPR9_9BACT|nr:HNH endonuclease [Thermonema lapsum]NIK73382.1 hypothetical protein [Thermonema lapsum]
MGKVLILNQDYSALTVCSAQKAFILLYLQKAELVKENPRQKLCTVNQAYPMPLVIRLHRYVNIPYKGVMLSRQNIFRRDGYSCQYCGSKHDLTLDHVLPRSRGGKSSWTNLVTACKRCNSKKGDLTPEEAGMPLRRRPYRPSFVVFLRNLSGGVVDAWMPFLGGQEV